MNVYQHSIPGKQSDRRIVKPCYAINASTDCEGFGLSNKLLQKELLGVIRGQTIIRNQKNNAQARTRTGNLQSCEVGSHPRKRT